MMNMIGVAFPIAVQISVDEAVIADGVDGTWASRYNNLSALLPQADNAFTLITLLAFAAKPLPTVTVMLFVAWPDTILTVGGTVH